VARFGATSISPNHNAPSPNLPETVGGFNSRRPARMFAEQTGNCGRSLRGCISLGFHFDMQHWRTRSRRTLVDDKWLCLHADECELPSGHIIPPYYVFEERDWVQIVAIDTEEKVLLTRQYRHGAKVVSTELPCGIMNGGETPLAAAQRELLEETGHAAAEWIPLPGLFPNPARQTNRIHSFFALQLHNLGSQALDASEDITFEFVSPGEIQRKIETGDFCHALHIASYFLALHYLHA